MSSDVEKKSAWEDSYARRENFLFYPADEVVRFSARYLRKRVGLDEFVDVTPGAAGERLLDVGCGIGRHLVFGHDLGLSVYGIDLSENAVRTARAWLERRGLRDTTERVQSASVERLPWQDGFFDHVVSDSVFDSMTFSVAEAGVREIARVLKPSGYFYLSLISGDESGRAPGFAGEVVVAGTHERNTFQSYFDRAKIERMLGSAFELLRLQHTRQEDALTGTHHARWHVTARRRAGR